MDNVSYMVDIGAIKELNNRIRMLCDSLYNNYEDIITLAEAIINIAKCQELATNNEVK